ncbi:glycosyl hydrolase, partial [Virgibacillus profundi]
ASDFVRPRAVRIGSRAAGPGAESLRSTAFRNPEGDLATIVVNTGAERTFDLAVGDRHVEVTIPAGSVATYVLP